MGPLWIANMVVLAAAMVVFAFVMILYIRSYITMRSRALGNIMALSAILMSDSFIAVIIYYFLSLRYGAWLASVLLVINSVSLIGYLFLFRALNV
ncbi:MAG: hypothetical protein M1306_02515 [Candidatus Thermoplasmatota archaeon]|nr:hypothetical protein [Candidatus Thermoplasmatota archaeon]